ncbi:hypothetical protein ACIBHX_47915 [Nonomuraea sp. NPDC050536]|uniref:hypothetical protein n=1 Tax=Nonomuraea sp. NPDC050536 TaxID=3364366 RepID=UPI0037CBBBE3
MDTNKAKAFMATHARILDRHRFRVLMGEGDPAATLAALEAYRNPDGGYGWGLEPDLRAVESQPGGALHAFEVFQDVPSPRAVELCDWLESVTLPDGGLPFALPISDPAGCAPWWAGADPTVSSLQITSIVAATAHRVPAVAGHPWLARATEYCRSAIAALDEMPHALVLAFSVRFLDTVGDTDLLAKLGRFIPADGRVHVAGGTEEEYMWPLDFAPDPDGPARALLDPAVVRADLDRLAGLQQDDGGWPVDYAGFSAQSPLEWRGMLTINAIRILRMNR